MQKTTEEAASGRLTDYLEQQIRGFKGPVAMQKFAVGQSNPTYLLHAASGQYVLRRKPPGTLLKSAHAIDREFRILTALDKTDVPTPTPIHLCDDESIIGSMFYVMSYAQGRSFSDPALPELDRHQRADIYDAMNRALVAVHQVDIAAVGLGNYGKKSHYLERQISRWQQQYRASETEAISTMEHLMQWLPANLPADDGKISLIHGDFRLDNLIFHPTENTIIALLDWELSTLGHPWADIAYQCMQWRMAARGEIKGLGDLDRTALGIPSEAAYVATYCQRMGIADIPDWNFYLIFNFFRFAAITQGVKKRALEGNATSDYAIKIGRLVKPLSAMGVALIDH